MKQWIAGAGAAISLMVLSALPWAKWMAPPVPVTMPTPATPAAPDPETKIRESIERTKGDYNLLTVEEKSRLDGVSMGHGREFFEYRVKQWKQKQSQNAVVANNKDVKK